MVRDRLTVCEAAEYIPISVVSLRRMLTKRQIKHIRIGRRILIEKIELDRFLAEHKTT